MIGTTVTPATPVGTPVLVMRGGKIVQVGLLTVAGETRIKVSSTGREIDSVRYDAEEGYVWRRIDTTAYLLLRNNISTANHYRDAAAEFDAAALAIANGDTP